MSYDTRCLMTAEYFLGQPRTAADEQSLAQAIQDAVEAWFAANATDHELAMLNAALALYDTKEMEP